MKVKVKSLSCVWHFAAPWTLAYQAPLSMGFSRQEYWSGLPFPSPGDLPKPGIEPRSPTLQGDALSSEPSGKLFGPCDLPTDAASQGLGHHSHLGAKAASVHSKQDRTRRDKPKGQAWPHVSSSGISFLF